MHAPNRLLLLALSLCGLLGQGCGASVDDEAASSNAAQTLTCASPLGRAVAEDAAQGENTFEGEAHVEESRVVEGPVVGGKEIAGAIKRLIATAQREILIESFDFDERSWLAGQVREAVYARGGDVQVRILVPNFPFRGKNPPYITESPGDAIERITAFFDRPNVVVGVLPRNGALGLGALHSRQIVVDGRRALITDANMQWNADPQSEMGSNRVRGAEWYQLATVVEGRIGERLRAEFRSAWDQATLARGVAGPLVDALSILAASSCTPMAVYGRKRLAGHDAASNRAFVSLFEHARSEVRVLTPNLNDAKDALNPSAGALDALAAATADADVYVIVSKGFNDWSESLPGQGGTNEENVPRLAEMATTPCNLHVRWFAGEDRTTIVGNGSYANHAKFASADGTTMLVGSQNMDTQSWKVSRELVLMIDSAEATARYDAEFDRVWERSEVAFECKGRAER